MVIISADLPKDFSSDAIRYLRQLLVPVACIEPVRFKQFRVAKVIVAYVKNENDIRRLLLYSGKTPLFLLGDTDFVSLEGLNVRKITGYKECVSDICSIYSLCKKPTEEIVSFNGGEVYYNNVRLPLTLTEKLIMSFLADEKDGVFSASQISEFCRTNSGPLGNSVAYHISKINSKTSKTVGYPLISCVRYKGYYLNV